MLDLCIEILDRCPNNCMFCSSNSCISKDTMISFERFKMAIDKFILKGEIKELSISGGEPLLHPNIYEMIEYAKSKGIRTVLYTSGIKYWEEPSQQEKDYYLSMMEYHKKMVLEENPTDTEQLDKIENFYTNMMSPKKFSSISREVFRKLELLGLDKIVFDVQGYEYETDNYLMGRTPKMHEMVIESLDRASRTNIETDIHFVPMKPNKDEIGDIIELADIGNLNSISILKFVPQGRGKINQEKLELTEEELENFRIKLNEYSSMYSVKIRTGIHMQKENIHQCNAGYTKFHIRYDGIVLPCPSLKELTYDTAHQYGIKLYTIEEIDKIEIIDTTRVIPLCQKVYKRTFL